nr:integrase, catalytic region, zinc finger, CCHC-type, peptidase aspartic, catalytic [Tanacetum cinerariifolium]
MELECEKVRGDLLSYKMDYHKSFTKYTDTINALNQMISEMKDKLSAPQETISILSQQKEAQTKLYKTRKEKELDKVIELEQKVKVLDNIVYKTGQSVQTMNMLNNKCRKSFAKPSINVQDLETNLYWEFRKFTSQDGESLESYYSRFYKMMNELIRNQYDVTNHQVNVQFLFQLQPEWQRSQKAATRNRGKAIVNSPQPIYDQEPSMIAEDDEMSKDNEIDKLMALISLSSIGYENQRIGNVAGARETVEQADWRDDTDDESEYQELEAHYMYMAQIREVSSDVADSGPIFDDEPLQKVSNDDHYNVFAIESEHPKQSESVHDTYLIEQDAHNVIIDSLDMSCDREQIDKNDNDNDLANERELLASLIEKLKCEIDDSKNRNKFFETSNKVLVEKLKGEIEDFKNKNLYNNFKKSQAKLERRNDVKYASKKEAQIKLYKTREDKELDKVIALENKVKVLDNIVYKTSQSVQTMNMLNNKCRMSFAKPEFLKKARRANHRLKSTCIIRDLKGNDLLTGSRGTDLYSIILQDTNSPNPICLMAKATSSQAWLWHRRL